MATSIETRKRKKSKRRRKTRISGFRRLMRLVILMAIITIGVLSVAKGRFILVPELKLTIQGEAEQEIAAFSEYKDAGAVAKRGRTDLTDLIQTTGKVDTTVPGNYTINYAVSYRNDTCKAQRIVHVIDNVAPVIELEGKSKMTLSLRSMYNEPGYTATDRCDGDLTKRVEITEKQEDDVCILTYTVADKAGNKASAARILEIKDIVAPELTVNGAEHEYVALNDKYKDQGATAKDDADGDLTDAVQCSGKVDTAKTGDYTITYTVTDRAGNQTTAERKVTVYQESSKSDNRVYLTFDDGPSSSVTPRILDILKKNHVKATFFILKYSDADKPILQRMINEGHTIGIHGYSHDYATIYSSEKAFMESVYRLRDMLKKDFGYDAKVIRFPGGSSNTVSRDYSKGIMTRLTKRVEQEGFTYFDWNVTSGDANGNNIAKSTIYSNTTKGLTKGHNNVILMHDTNYKVTTADALQEIINYARSNGYVFLPITSNTVPCHHGVAN